MDGTPFGRYRLIELLGRGGMGEVWRAYDTAANNRMVAIKLLPSILASDITFVQRFRREAGPAGPATQEVLLLSGLGGPSGVAVDSASTLYVTDYFINRVLKMPVQ